MHRGPFVDMGEVCLKWADNLWYVGSASHNWFLATYGPVVSTEVLPSPPQDLLLNMTSSDLTCVYKILPHTSRGTFFFVTCPSLNLVFRHYLICMCRTYPLSALISRDLRYLRISEEAVVWTACPWGLTRLTGEQREFC